MTQEEKLANMERLRALNVVAKAKAVEARRLMKAHKEEAERLMAEGLRLDQEYAQTYSAFRKAVCEYAGISDFFSIFG